MRDASGQFYRRNRYFDPATGRFTQEDPIGLAGGLNLYAFGGGDPVTYGDPYRLCPDYLEESPLACVGYDLMAALDRWAQKRGAGGAKRLVTDARSCSDQMS